MADIWKENVLEDLEAEKKEYKSVGELFIEIKKEFRRGAKELLKVAELKEIKQGSRIIKEFVQDFKRAARGSGYIGCLLIKEFKWSMNGAIRRKLMEAEKQLSFIEQWFKRVIALDRNWRESRREEERLREIEERQEQKRIDKE